MAFAWPCVKMKRFEVYAKASRRTRSHGGAGIFMVYGD